MATDKRKKYQRIVSQVIAAAGNSFNLNELATDKRYKYVTGYAVSILGDETGIRNSLFNTFEIDLKEVFPANFDAQFIFVGSNLDVSPNEKFYANLDLNGIPLVFPAQNSIVNIGYTDGSFAGVAYPYTLNVWLRLENPTEKETKLNEFMQFQQEQYEEWKEIQKHV